MSQRAPRVGPGATGPCDEMTETAEQARQRAPRVRIDKATMQLVIPEPGELMERVRREAESLLTRGCLPPLYRALLRSALDSGRDEDLVEQAARSRRVCARMEAEAEATLAREEDRARVGAEALIRKFRGSAAAARRQ